MLQPFIKLPPDRVIEGRQDFVLERCRGKTVLHVGCIDAGLLHERFARGELMHQRLCEIAESVWGVDVDTSGIEYLRAQGYDHLQVADAETLADQDALRSQSFDVIVATELLEHLANPGLFLTGVRELMIPGRTELIVSVPNAFRLNTLYRVFRQVELVHPDHNCWYSHSTIVNLLRKHDLEVQRTQMYVSGCLPRVTWSGFEQRLDDPRALVRHLGGAPKRLFEQLIYRAFPYFGDGIIVVASLARTRP